MNSPDRHLGETDDNRSLQNVAVLGATGSIGTATVDVLNHLNQVDPDHRWRMWAASGHSNLECLSQMAESVAEIPEQLVLSDEQAAASYQRRGRLSDVKVSVGAEALVDAAIDPAVDIVVAAIVGPRGFRKYAGSL